MIFKLNNEPVALFHFCHRTPVKLKSYNFANFRGYRIGPIPDNDWIITKNLQAVLMAVKPNVAPYEALEKQIRSALENDEHTKLRSQLVKEHHANIAGVMDRLLPKEIGALSGSIPFLIFVT